MNVPIRNILLMLLHLETRLGQRHSTGGRARAPHGGVSLLKAWWPEVVCLGWRDVVAVLEGYMLAVGSLDVAVGNVFAELLARAVDQLEVAAEAVSRRLDGKRARLIFDLISRALQA